MDENSMPPAAGAQYQQQQPVPGQPAPGPAGQPPPKKSSTALILIIVAIVVLLCSLTLCGFGAFALLNSELDTEETIEQADAYYDSAALKVEEIDLYYSEDFANVEGEGGESQAEEILSEVNGAIEVARDDLAESKGYIDSLEESTFKTEYLDAIALMNQSVDAYEQLYAGMPEEIALHEELDAMLAELDAADGHLTEATRAASDEDYAKAKSEAQTALAAYTEAETYFTALAEEYPGREFDVQAALEALHVDAADAVRKAAEEGLAGDIDGYNGYVTEYQAANDKIQSATWPAWYDDWSQLWNAADVSYDEAYGYYAGSIEAYNRSVDAYNAGQY